MREMVDFPAYPFPIFYSSRMGKPNGVPLQSSEQHVLDHFRVVLLSDPNDMALCELLIVEHHYLHDATLVGEHLSYAVVYRGQSLALASWTAAALHRRERDTFIGWTQ